MTEQKVCIITGGSAGIGLATVSTFIEAGYRVFNLDLVASEQGEFIQCDMGNTEQVEQAVAEVVSIAGRIDVVVSNAGIYYSGTIEQTSDDDFDRVMNINVKGAFRLVKACLLTMKEQQGGVFCIVASDQALVGKKQSFIYNMSKVAMASLTRTTALDYADYGIRCNAVCPGTIDTPLYHQAIENYCRKSGESVDAVHQSEALEQPIGRIGKAQEVAELIYFLCSEKAGFITGSLHSIDGGYTAR